MPRIAYREPVQIPSTRRGRRRSMVFDPDGRILPSILKGPFGYPTGSRWIRGAPGSLFSQLLDLIVAVKPGRNPLEGVFLFRIFHRLEQLHVAVAQPSLGVKSDLAHTTLERRYLQKSL